jgi:hypothetical protein
MALLEKLSLMPGELVEVRSQEEILATLDDAAVFDNMVFMPEMLQYCGRRFRVYKRADKTCETVKVSGMLRLDNTVHLALTRCDGCAHGGCQAACLLFWKEAWLKRVGKEAEPHDHAAPATDGQLRRDRAWLEATAIRSAEAGEPIVYRCQATEIEKTGTPLKWYHFSQYVRDVRANGVPVRQIVFSLAVFFFNRLRHKLGKPPLPNVTGKLKRTPTEVLDLQVGEWVVVKSRDDILATVDHEGRNRGMTFEAEMIPYCDKVYRVVARVDRIVDERTGRIRQLGSVGIILQDVICASAYRTPCPRANYLYWREIWLRRAEPHEIPQPPEGAAECALSAARV